MKKLLFLATMLSCGAALNAQSAKVLNDKINQSLAKLDAVKSMTGDGKFDSIISFNHQLAQNIVAFAEGMPDFIRQDLKDTGYAVNDMYNSVADDKHLRIIYWDDASGGSLRNYDYIVFWDQGGKLHHKSYIANIEDTDSSAIYYTYIDSVVHFKQNDGKDLYFVMGGTFNRPTFYNQHIFGFKIDANGAFTNDAPLFKPGNKILHQIAVDCPYYSDSQQSGISFYTLMHFSKDKQLLYVPIFPDVNNAEEQERQKSDTTGTRKFNYFQYRFDGNHFTYKKN